MPLRYLRWLGEIVFHGSLGRSLWRNTPVTSLLAERMPVTFEFGLPPLGCRFHTRCPRAMDRCRAEDPAPIQQPDGQVVSRHLYD